MNKATTTIIIVVLLVLVVGFIAFTPEKSEKLADEESTFGQQVSYEITGIDAGAGIMQHTEQAMEIYGLTNWELKAGSDSAMTTAVQTALENEQPIVATAWTPHALFILGELRQLQDPEMIYNNPAKTRSFLEEYAPEFADLEVQSDVIATLARSNFAEAAPLAYEILVNFSVNTEAESQWVYEVIIEGRQIETVATEWFEANRDQFNIPEEQELGQNTIIIGTSPRTGEIVRSQILANLLEEAGYEIEIEELEVGLVYTSLAENDIDLTLGGWLPTTHQSYWEEFGDDLEIAGINISETWLGLVVPDYADENIQSIADLAE